MNLVELQEKGVELYLVEDNAIRKRGDAPTWDLVLSALQVCNV